MEMSVCRVRTGLVLTVPSWAGGSACLWGDVGVSPTPQFIAHVCGLQSWAQLHEFAAGFLAEFLLRLSLVPLRAGAGHRMRLEREGTRPLRGCEKDPCPPRPPVLAVG